MKTKVQAVFAHKAEARKTVSCLVGKGYSPELSRPDLDEVEIAMTRQDPLRLVIYGGLIGTAVGGAAGLLVGNFFLFPITAMVGGVAGIVGAFIYALQNPTTADKAHWQGSDHRDARKVCVDVEESQLGKVMKCIPKQNLLEKAT